MKIIPQAQKAIELLEQNGFSAYIVGGCVRDYVMGKTPQDTDIATSALPNEIQRVFGAYRLVEAGIKHGTVTVIINKVPLEITTFRTDGQYTDHRHPSQVLFSGDLKQDTARRDFTVNALCYNSKEGIIDFWSGISDIKNKIIRTVGNPCDRFGEDALRIMRALRFSSVLNFEIEENTSRAMFEKAYLLKDISAQRLYEELIKLLCGDNVKNVLLKYFDIFSAFLPDLAPMKGFKQNNPHHLYDVWTHTALTVQNCPKTPILRLAALLHDCGKPSVYTEDERGIGHFYHHGEKSLEYSRDILKQLKADSETTQTVLLLVKYHDYPITATEKGVLRALNKFGKDNLNLLLQLKRADNSAQNTADYDRTREYDSLQAIIDRVIEKQACFSLKQLKVKGNDLTALGLAPSQKTGQVLNELLELVIDGKLENRKEALLEYAKKLI